MQKPLRFLFLAAALVLPLAGCAGDPRPGSPEAQHYRHVLDFDEAGIAGVSGTKGPQPFAPEVTPPVGIR